MASASGAVTAVCAVGLSPTVLGVGLCAPAATVTVVAGVVSVGAHVVAAAAGAPNPGSLVLDGLTIFGGGVARAAGKIPGAAEEVIGAAKAGATEFLNVMGDLADHLIDDVSKEHDPCSGAW